MKPSRVDLEGLARALDELKASVKSRLGSEDVERIKRVRRFSRRLEWAGRALIHFSLEPLSFGLGVLALAGHKLIEGAEIGHNVLHGQYDGLPGAEDFQSATFRWEAPIDEQSWREGHNVQHHMFANVAGKDPDIRLGTLRLTSRTSFRWFHSLQVPLTAGGGLPNFMFLMNLHFTGVLDWLLREGQRRGERTFAQALWRALRKAGPYYLRNYGVFPALAGPWFGKVLFGNWLAETMRDICLGLIILCGHVGEEVSDFPEGTQAKGRGEWYYLQLLATHNVRLPHWQSVLCGALDHQIEHHLFPKLPPNRLREIAPRVEQICQEWGFPYRSAPVGPRLWSVAREIARLSRPNPGGALGGGPQERAFPLS